MPSARERLLDMAAPDAELPSPRALRELQLRAAQELLEERIAQVPLLARRVASLNLTRLERFEDLVPLLFAHTTYKSYPQALIDQGKWDRLLAWLRTVAAFDPCGIDMHGVENIDQWIDRLWAGGFEILATSGSSGRCSLIPRGPADRAVQRRQLQHAMAWGGLMPGERRAFFALAPRRGPNMFIVVLEMLAEMYARPDAIHYLSDVPLKVSEVSRAAQLRKRMADGAAQPGEIEAFERELAERGRAGAAALERLADVLVAHRREPVYVSGQWAQHLSIIARARELGVGDGEFHPRSYVAAGGGVKAIKLPPDYKEQVRRFYGAVLSGRQYGMTEISQLSPACAHGRYHVPPAVVVLLVDGPGEALLNREEGVATGRFAFLDLAVQGRWGGLIAGDRVEVDFSRCACGRIGPTIADTIERWAPPGEDDYIGCAGTLESYVRQSIGS